MLVLKIGGSILYKNGKLDTAILKAYVDVIQMLQKRKQKLAVVIGGGFAARDFIQTAAVLGTSKSVQDWLGIESARQNARLFISLFPESCPEPPRSYEELLAAFRLYGIVFLGGLQPGQSTNAVAAVVAEMTQATLLINLTDVDYVYDKDPVKYKDAIRLDRITYQELAKIVTSNAQDPGKYDLFDIVAVQIIERSKICLNFLNGKNPYLILDVLNDKPVGTVVYD